jgi:hypothetical protein
VGAPADDASSVARPKTPSRTSDHRLRDRWTGEVSGDRARRVDVGGDPPGGPDESAFAFLYGERRLDEPRRRAGTAEGRLSFVRWSASTGSRAAPRTRPSASSSCLSLSRAVRACSPVGPARNDLLRLHAAPSAATGGLPGRSATSPPGRRATPTDRRAGVRPPGGVTPTPLPDRHEPQRCRPRAR